MPDSLMYQQEHFVVLETAEPEKFLTKEELLEKLKTVLENMIDEDLPQDMRNLVSRDDQAQYLIDISCELDMGPGKYLQWYAVRLEK